MVKANNSEKIKSNEKDKKHKHSDSAVKKEEDCADLFQECLLQVIEQLEKFDAALKQAQQDGANGELAKPTNESNKKLKTTNDELPSHVDPDLHVRKTRHRDYSMAAVSASAPAPAKVGMKRRRQHVSQDKKQECNAAPAKDDAKRPNPEYTGKRRGRKRKNASEQRGAAEGSSSGTEPNSREKKQSQSSSPSKPPLKPVLPFLDRPSASAVGKLGSSAQQQLPAHMKAAPRGKGFRLRDSQGQLSSTWEGAQAKVSSGEKSPSAPARPAFSSQRPPQHPPLKLMTGSTPIAIGLTSFVLESLKEGPCTFKDLCQTVTQKFEKDIDYFVRYNDKERKQHANTDIATVCAVLRSLGVIKDLNTPLVRPVRENPYMPQFVKPPDVTQVMHASSSQGDPSGTGSAAPVPKPLSAHVADVLQFLKKRIEQQRRAAREARLLQAQRAAELHRQQQQLRRQQQWSLTEIPKSLQRSPSGNSLNAPSGKVASLASTIRLQRHQQQQQQESSRAPPTLTVAGQAQPKDGTAAEAGPVLSAQRPKNASQSTAPAPAAPSSKSSQAVSSGSSSVKQASTLSTPTLPSPTPPSSSTTPNKKQALLPTALDASRPQSKHTPQAPVTAPTLSPSPAQPPGPSQGKSQPPVVPTQSAGAISQPPQVASAKENKKKDSKETPADQPVKAEQKPPGAPPDAGASSTASPLPSSLDGEKLQARTPAKAQGPGSGQSQQGQSQGQRQAGQGQGQGGQPRPNLAQASANQGSTRLNSIHAASQVQSNATSLSQARQPSAGTASTLPESMAKGSDAPASKSSIFTASKPSSPASFDASNSQSQPPPSQPKSLNSSFPSQNVSHKSPQALPQPPNSNAINRSRSHSQSQPTLDSKFQLSAQQQLTHRNRSSPSLKPAPQPIIRSPSSLPPPVPHHPTPSQAKSLQQHSSHSQQEAQMKIHPRHHQSHLHHQKLNSHSLSHQSQLLQQQAQLHLKQKNHESQLKLQQFNKKTQTLLQQQKQASLLQQQQKAVSHSSSNSRSPVLSSSPSKPISSQSLSSNVRNRPLPRAHPSLSASQTQQNKLQSQVSRQSQLQNLNWQNLASSQIAHSTQSPPQKSFIVNAATLQPQSPGRIPQQSALSNSAAMSQAPSSSLSSLLQPTHSLSSQPSRTRGGIPSPSQLPFLSAGGQQSNPQQLHKFATAREMQAQNSNIPATARELQARQQAAHLQVSKGLSSLGTGPGRPDFPTGLAAHSVAQQKQQQQQSQSQSQNSFSIGSQPESSSRHQLQYSSSPLSSRYQAASPQRNSTHHGLMGIPAKALHFAEAGEFGVLQDKSSRVYEAAVHWLTEKSESFFFQPLAFDLALNGQFTELERRYGPSIALMMMVWVVHQSTDWLRLKKQRETVVKVSHPYSLGHYEHEAEFYFNTSFQLDSAQDMVCGMLPVKIAEASHAALRRANMLLREENLLRDLCKRNGVSLQNLLAEVSSEPSSSSIAATQEASPWGPAPAGVEESEEKLPQAVVVPLPPLIEMTAEQLARKVGKQELVSKWQTEDRPVKKDFFNVPPMFTSDDFMQEMDLVTSTESSLEQELMGMDLSLDLNSPAPHLPSATMSYNSSLSNGAFGRDLLDYGPSTGGKKGRGRGKRHEITNAQRLQMVQLRIDQSLKCNSNLYGICSEPISWNEIASQFQVVDQPKDLKEASSIPDHSKSKIIDLLKTGEREIIAPAVKQIEDMETSTAPRNDSASSGEDTDDELYLKRHEAALSKMKNKYDRIMQNPTAPFRRRL